MSTRGGAALGAGAEAVGAGAAPGVGDEAGAEGIGTSCARADAAAIRRVTVTTSALTAICEGLP